MLDYLDVLAELHRSRRPRTYLEIGIYRGDALRLALDGTLCVGVDPEPALAAEDEHRWQIETMTSDAFFAGTRPQELFGELPVDLVFIDGLHHFEYALRDFFNAERLVSAESLVVLHDVLPIDAASAARDRTTDDWTGDIWKLVLCLMDRRPDLNLTILDVLPSGLCLVRGLDPENATLRNDYEAIIEHYLPMEFDAWEARVEDVLERTTDNDESRSWAFRRDLAAARDEVDEARESATAALRDRLAEGDAERCRLLDRLAEIEAERTDLLGQLAESNAARSRVAERLAESEARAAALTRQIQDVSASTSWRLTAPLRRAGSLLRRDERA